MPVVAISTSPLSATGSSHLGNRSSFGGHVFDVAKDQLLRGSTTVKLTPKALLLLRHFVHHPDRVLTKDALMAAIWGPTVVTENSLVQLVVELRTALGDKEQQIVKTVPRRGYLFAAPVQWLGQESPQLSGVRPSRRRRLWAGISTLACLALLLTTPSPPAGGVDAQWKNALPVFVAPFVEGDANGDASPIGRRIADDVSALLVRLQLGTADQEDRAKLAISGRLLRRTPNGIAVDVQLRDLSSGTRYSLLEASFRDEHELIASDLSLRVVRAMVGRRHEIILARARQSAHPPDALELLNLAWYDYWLADTEADLARAGARFEAVLQKDPSSVSARFGRSMACYQTFHMLFSPAPRATLAECERQVRELYSRAPEDNFSMQAMATSLYWQGKPEEALWLLRKALVLWPADRSLNPMMALLLIREGRFDEAAPYLEITRSLAERRQEHGPSDRRRQVGFYHVFADRAVLQGHDDESREWLLRWTAEFPDDGRPYLLLAAIDALHGRDEQAKSHMARHRQLLPQSNLHYVSMLNRTSNPAVMAVRARLLEGMRRAGLPEGG